MQDKYKWVSIVISCLLPEGASNGYTTSNHRQRARFIHSMTWKCWIRWLIYHWLIDLTTLCRNRIHCRRKWLKDAWDAWSFFCLFCKWSFWKITVSMIGKLYLSPQKNINEMLKWDIYILYIYIFFYTSVNRTENSFEK